MFGQGAGDPSPSKSAPRIAAHEGGEDSSRTQSAEPAGRHVGDPPGGAPEMAGRGEMKQADHDWGSEPGIPEELRGRGDAGEIDHPLQIGRTTGPELAGEML